MIFRSAMSDSGRQAPAAGDIAAMPAQFAKSPAPAARARDDEERLSQFFPGIQSWHVAVRYAIALGAVGAAIGAHWALAPILGDQSVIATLFIVLLPLLLIVRPRTFLIAALVGLAASWHLFVQRRSPFGVEGTLFTVQSIPYVAAGFAAAAAASLAQAIRRRLSVAEHRVSLAQNLASVGFFDTGWATDVVERLSAGPVTLTAAKPDNRVVPEDLAQVKTAIKAAIERGLSDVNFEYGALGPDGGSRRFAAAGQLSYRERDRAVRLRGAIVDVTDRGRAAEALRLANQRKDEFLAALGHELRNPLGAIRNSIAIMRPGMSNEHLAWCHDVIKRQTDHVARLVDDLLDVSRISQGKLSLHKEPVDLAHIIRNAVEIARPLLDRRSLAVSLQLPPEAVMLDGDPVRLTQVFANLLSNAAKFSPNGGPIKLTGERRVDEIVVGVADQGIGIPPEALPTLFEIFSQPQRPVDGTETGLGLGLALVRKLVHLHGGTVQAYSAGRGHGSEFVVRLPVKRETRDLGHSLRGRG